MVVERIRGRVALAAATLATIGGLALHAQPAEAAPVSETVAAQSGNMAGDDPDQDGVPNMLDVHPGENDALFDADSDGIPDWKDVDYRTWRDPDADKVVDPYDSRPLTKNSVAYPAKDPNPSALAGWFQKHDADKDGIANKYDETPTPAVNDRDLDGLVDAKDPHPNNPTQPDLNGQAKVRSNHDLHVQAEVHVYDKVKEQADAVHQQEKQETPR